jgi:hypothetical protein
MKTQKIIIIALFLLITLTWTYVLVKCCEEYKGVF